MTSAPASESNHGVVPVPDYTSWNVFVLAMINHIVSFVDAFAWIVYDALVLSVFSAAALVWWAIELLVKIVFGLGHNFGLGCMRAEDEHGSFRNIPMSPVNAAYPNMHTRYASAMSGPRYESLRKKLQGTVSICDRTLDPEIAKFSMHLSALAYETPEVVEYVLGPRCWGREVQLSFKRFGHSGLFALLVWSVDDRWCTITCRGTGLFNLSEWLLDASLNRMACANGVLPGMLHSGFLTAFGLPLDMLERSRGPKAFNDIENRRQLQAAAKNVPAQNKISQRTGFWEQRFIPEVSYMLDQVCGQDKPGLLVSGHSLGAATASILGAIILHTCGTDIGKASPVQNIKWSSVADVRAVVVGGTPRTGNQTFSNLTNELVKLGKLPFFRITNGNDIVASLPLSMDSIVRLIVPSYYEKRVEEYLQTSPYWARHDGLLNFFHCGKSAVLLNGFNGVERIELRERSGADFLSNCGAKVIQSAGRLIHPGSLTAFVQAAVEISTFGLSSFLTDHAPGEYLESLDMALPVN